MVVVKEFTFDSAHQLVGYKGDCSNFHGHTYRLLVAVGGKKINRGSSRDMVIDFKDLKSIVKKRVLNFLDHKTILSGDEELCTVLSEYSFTLGLSTYDILSKVFGANGWFILGRRTTAENIAEFIFESLLTEIPGLCYIELYETPTSMVRVDRKEMIGDEQ